MPSNQELLAEAVANIPAWLTFLDEKQAEQERLRTELRAKPEGQQTTVEMAVPAVVEGEDGKVAPGSEESSGSVVPVTGSVPREGPDSSSPTTPLDPPPGASVSQTGTVSTTGLAERFGLANSLKGTTSTSFQETDRKAGAAPQGNQRGGAPPEQGVQGNEPAGLNTLLDESSSELTADFQQALDEANPTDLPLPLRDAMTYGEVEDVAEELLGASRNGELPSPLTEAVERLAEENIYLREAAERLDEQAPSDDWM